MRPLRPVPGGSNEGRRGDRERRPSRGGGGAYAAPSSAERGLRIPAGPTLCGLAFILVLSGVLFTAMGFGHGIDSAPAFSWMPCAGIFTGTGVFLILCWPGEVVIGTNGVLVREMRALSVRPLHDAEESRPTCAACGSS